MKTRILAILMAVMMLASSAALAEAAPAGVTGSFSGTHAGYAGDVTVTYTIENNELAAMEIEAGDEEGFSGKVIDQMLAQFEETGMIPDAVASATATSTAVWEASVAALTTAGF